MTKGQKYLVYNPHLLEIYHFIPKHRYMREAHKLQAFLIIDRLFVVAKKFYTFEKALSYVREITELLIFTSFSAWKQLMLMTISSWERLDAEI